MTFPTEEEARNFLAMRNSLAVVIPTTHGYWVITDPTEAERPEKICSICGEPFREFACNPRPFPGGKCCAYCDDHVVTPARIVIAREMGL
jgi:hypothetical protein